MDNWGPPNHKTMRASLILMALLDYLTVPKYKAAASSLNNEVKMLESIPGENRV